MAGAPRRSVHEWPLPGFAWPAAAASFQTPESVVSGSTVAAKQTLPSVRNTAPCRSCSSKSSAKCAWAEAPSLPAARSQCPSADVTTVSTNADSIAVSAAATSNSSRVKLALAHGRIRGERRTAGRRRSGCLRISGA